MMSAPPTSAPMRVSELSPYFTVAASSIAWVTQRL